MVVVPPEKLLVPEVVSPPLRTVPPVTAKSPSISKSFRALTVPDV